MITIRSEFGPHLMMDCRQCDADKINDLDYVYQFLDSLPDEIGMHKVTRPHVIPYEGLIPEDKGITGVVVIAESHITFHSFTEKDYFFFDIFSCKPFDIELVKERVIEAFGVRRFESHLVDRGRYFPRTVEERAPLNRKSENSLQEISS